jgi:hypothetical protein
MDFPPIFASYYDDNYGNKSFIDVVFDDPDYHLKIMYQLIHPTQLKHKKLPNTNTPVSYPITPFEVSQMEPVVQPIIPIIIPIQQTQDNNVVMNVVGNIGMNQINTNPSKSGRPGKKITDDEYLTRRRELARESARRCRQKKRELIEESKKKLKMLREKNKSLLLELTKLKTENSVDQ